MTLWRSPRLKRLRRELRTRALLGAMPLLARLPLPLALALGAALGEAGYWVAAKERRRALRHLALAFPDWPEARRRAVCRRSFRNLGRSALELASAGLRHARLREWVELPEADRALLAAAHAEGRGVVFLAGHLGNWELLARRVAFEGYRAGTVAREAKDPRLTALLEASRARAGVATFWRGHPGLARQLLALLRAGGLLGLLIDQDTDVQGTFVPFFGRPAFTPRAGGDLAVRTGAPVIVGTIGRLPGGRHRVRLQRVSAEASGDREVRSLALTARATQLLEQAIRERPDEWVWMHERWKKQPPSSSTF